MPGSPRLHNFNPCVPESENETRDSVCVCEEGRGREVNSGRSHHKWCERGGGVDC